MNKSVLKWIILLVIWSNTSIAQNSLQIDRAQKYIERKSDKWDLSKSDIENLKISDIYTDSNSGMTYIYFQQTIDGIKISKAITPIVINAKGKIFNAGNRFISNAKKKLVSANWDLSAQQSLQHAANHLGIKNTVIQEVRSITQNVFKAQNIDFVDNEVKVSKQYVYKNGKIWPVWSTELDIKKSPDFWNIKINASDGKIIEQDNYTMYCKHSDIHNSYCNHNVDKVENEGQGQDYNGNLVLMEGSYMAFSLPTESPLYGSRTLVQDNTYWNASPFGWHDTNNAEGAEYIITRGNNAHVYQDRTDLGFSSNDEPSGGSSLIFDFPFDIEKEAEENESAGIVNAFVVANQIHDILYQLGFTENAGNFQQNNYNKGGIGNDYVRVETFYGLELSEPLLNNASFRTPRDGDNGVMRLRLWENEGGDLKIESPLSIQGFINSVGTADFGIPIPTPQGQPIVGKVVIARDDSEDGTFQNCEVPINDSEISGNIALVDRGLCDFSLKTYNVQQAGAVACLICNVPGADGPGSSGENVIGMAAGDREEDVTITAAFLPTSVCNRIREQIQKGEDVTISLQKQIEELKPKYRDVAFDNGVIVHEYGHGLSNRLVGGPNEANCLSNIEQMGEGISDFLTLILTVKEGDTREDIRGIGNFVDFQASNGKGIRTYPYTTNLDVNPRTYQEIVGFINDDGDPMRYSIGEIWTSALWELYWNVVDEKGLDVTWKDEKAGNFVVGRLVIEGMKLAPCGPSMIEMRDAILEADTLLYDGNHSFEIWSAFAKRGMGYGAIAGDPNVLEDAVASYEIFPRAIETLKISKIGNISAKAGEKIEITLIAHNHIDSLKTGVTITDQIPDNLSFVQGSANFPVQLNGDELIFEIGTMNYLDEVIVTYSVLVNEDIKSESIYYDNIDDRNIDYEYTIKRGFDIWDISDLEAHSLDESLYIVETDDIENIQSVGMNNIEIVGEKPVLRFFHKYDTQPVFDGGYLSISSEGSKYETINDKFIRNSYNSFIDYSTFAIPNVEGFSGSSNGVWLDSYVDLSEYKGKNINIRFNFGTDDEEASTAQNPGWFVDDIEVLDLEAINSTACIQSDEGDDMQCSQVFEIFVDSDSRTINTLDFDANQGYNISISPNPSDEYVKVEMKSKDRFENIAIQIADITGKLMKNTQLSKSSTAIRSFDVSDFHPGIYLISIYENNKLIHSEKIMVK